MAERTVPHNPEVEESLIGAMLLSRAAIEAAHPVVAASDFYSPALGDIFQAITVLWTSGEPVDPITVSEELRRSGTLESCGGMHRLIELQSCTASTTSAAKYAKIIVKSSVARRVIEQAIEIRQRAEADDLEAAELLDLARACLDGVDVPNMTDDLDGLWIMDEFLDKPMEERAPWVIPGLLRAGWRAMIVAGEGVGKTVMLRQMAIAAAGGVHPLNFSPMEPCRVLVVDLENPEDSIYDVCEPLRAQTQRVSTDYDPERVWLWHQPAGIDLRTRRDKASLEAVIMEAKPDLLCIGPVYKMYSLTAKESDEIAVRELMQVLDDLRTRHNFALLMEHHAPKGATSKSREMLPYGSSLWFRWPELGIGFVPADQENEVMYVTRWRGDRLENSWPTEIKRSSPWMWEGIWPKGTFDNSPTRSRPEQSGNTGSFGGREPVPEF